jgi:alpha-beta hydrolase superfamily lysophospholipase
MKRTLLFSIFLVVVGCTHQGLSIFSRKPSSALQPETEMMTIPGFRERLRTGIVMESAQKELKGCVLYLQGFSDSMMNHSPLFGQLSKSGFRVITFDYFGQGGSEGNMNATRVKSNDGIFADISEIADRVWAKYSLQPGPSGLNCGRKKFVLGWSTGGLAAYRMAHELKADAVILMTPGIKLGLIVGEKYSVTERSLTRAATSDHAKHIFIEEIRPTNPLGVPFFTANLFKTSVQSQNLKISSSVPGLVLLSGDNDSYVYSAETEKVIRQNAPHFEIHKYEGALHALDNELPAVSADVHDRIVQFLLKQ